MCEESAVQSNIKHEKHISAYVITLRVVFVASERERKKQLKKIHSRQSARQSE